MWWLRSKRASKPKWKEIQVLECEQVRNGHSPFPGASDSWDCHLWPLGALGWPFIFSLIPLGKQCLPVPTLHELGSSWPLFLYPTFIPNPTSPLSISCTAPALAKATIFSYLTYIQSLLTSLLSQHLLLLGAQELFMNECVGQALCQATALCSCGGYRPQTYNTQDV